MELGSAANSSPDDQRSAEYDMAMMSLRGALPNLPPSLDKRLTYYADEISSARDAHLWAKGKGDLKTAMEEAEVEAQFQALIEYNLKRFDRRQRSARAAKKIVVFLRGGRAGGSS
ncbi:hypothetical protein HY379_02100 [Candidatus Saccharibacteria bacterium]|nr:hypothetical protein [Candidatus Saccharibacteria bacterium]